MYEQTSPETLNKVELGRMWQELVADLDGIQEGDRLRIKLRNNKTITDTFTGKRGLVLDLENSGTLHLGHIKQEQGVGGNYLCVDKV